MPVTFDLEDPLALEKMSNLLDGVIEDDDFFLFDARALPDEAYW